MPMNLSAPWITLYRKIQAMFAKDEEIGVVLDEYDVRIYVNNPEKAESLDKLLNYQHTFGSVTSHVYVIPSNGAAALKGDEKKSASTDELFRMAFNGNHVLAFVQAISCPIGDFVYVGFAKEVVQYYNDDLGDPNGLCSTLYQEIAKDIFVSRPNLYYCTTPNAE